VSRIPRQARDGIMRAWLEILRERHPDVSWVPGTQERSRNEDEALTLSQQPERVQ
jgi:hypothetical protein